MFYADSVSKSMHETMLQNSEIRQIQEQYNLKHNIIPKTIIKPIPEPIHNQKMADAISFYFKNSNSKNQDEKLSKDELIEKLRKQMEQATKELDYERAMEIRDIIIELREGYISKSKES
nr:UvrB/UvrC motif-containing protein [Mycoplasmopsis bovis]